MLEVDSLEVWLPGVCGAAQDVNADGTVAVGRSATSDGTGNVAWRWSATGGMVSLGFLPGDDNSEAIGVSGNGNVVVGDSLNFAAFQANPSSQRNASRVQEYDGYSLQIQSMNSGTPASVAEPDRASFGMMRSTRMRSSR